MKIDQSEGIKCLKQQELNEALNLIKETFLKYEGPDYCEEGIIEFLNFIAPTRMKQQLLENQLQFYGYYKEEVLRGVITTRRYTHISMFFVRDKDQGQGIGRSLFERAIKEAKEQVQARQLTVNASPYAMKIYEKLGFEKLEEEQLKNGIRFTPMLLKLE